MILGKYTDDGYQEVHLDDVEFNTQLLVEILHDKGVLTKEDVQRLLPLNIDIISE